MTSHPTDLSGFVISGDKLASAAPAVLELLNQDALRQSPSLQKSSGVLKFKPLSVGTPA
jgi:hypothetical protein